MHYDTSLEGEDDEFFFSVMEAETTIKSNTFGVEDNYGQIAKKAILERKKNIVLIKGTFYVHFVFCWRKQPFIYYFHIQNHLIYGWTGINGKG